MANTPAARSRLVDLGNADSNLADGYVSCSVTHIFDRLFALLRITDRIPVDTRLRHISMRSNRKLLLF